MTIHQKKEMIIFSCILLSVLLCPNTLAASMAVVGGVCFVTTAIVITALVKKEYRYLVIRCTMREKCSLTVAAVLSVWYILVGSSYFNAL